MARTLFCTTDGASAINGINAWLVRFLPALRNRNHDVRALVVTWSSPESCSSIPLFKSAGIPVDVIDRPYSTEAVVVQCLNAVARSKPEIFIPNHVLPALYAAGWVRAAGTPTVAIWHNDDSEYRAKNDTFFLGNAFFRVSEAVGISRGLTDLYSLSKGPRGRCISYGLPLPSNEAQWRGDRPLRLIYHGRIVQQQKRILETTTAFVRVARNLGALADIYGSGPEYEAVRTLLLKDSADGRVRLCGSRSPLEVMSILPRYDVAVLLSEFEGLGLSILEAMACGLVPVCHRTASGLPDIIEHGRNGLFVDDRFGAFDAAIAKLANSPEEWSRLSRAARATVREKFSESACIEAWEALFSELCAAKGKGHLKVPWRIKLPPPHPALLSEDRRYPGLLRDLWRRIRFPRK